MPGDGVDVCVVGSLNVDLVVRATRLPAAGETVLGYSFDTFLGGKGFNQAVAAARCGARTAMVGCVGDDPFGRDLRAALDREGIDARHVGTAGAGTGVASIAVDAAGRNSITVVPRANEETVAAVVACRVVLLQLELPLDTVVAAARTGRELGATVVLNPAPTPAALAPFAGLVDYVVPNEIEAGVGCGDLGAAAVIVTRGGDGVDVHVGGEVVHVDAHAVECVDSVGAGDAFCGAFAAALAGGASLLDAVRFGNAAGAVAVTARGAEPSMPTAAAVRRLLSGN